MRLSYQKFHLMIFLFLVGTDPAITLGEFLKQTPRRGVYIDSHLKALELEETLEEPSFPKRLEILSRSVPVRIMRDKGYLKILPCFHRSEREKLAFRATIFLSRERVTDEILRKIHSMNHWFLRLRVDSALKEGNLWIEMEMSTQFFLNQFHEDVGLMAGYLFRDETLLNLLDGSRWLQLQRQLIWENYEGILPDLTTLPNPKFRRELRRGVLSDVYK